ncbi:uncharacterized protein LOC143550188 [Bidens hawaiensis]|uniref:uncharacterized protein LOC143550188 n=1 Tax=Bidens hawaiensis TaxID=980011 RepID=UPI00404B7222
MGLLNDEESFELLNTHAFGSKIPMLGYEELIARAIQYCEGNPLALKVLGSSMFKNCTIPNCKSQLNLLEKLIDSRIHDVLVRSYKSLPNDTVKELFLHIACFFIGKDFPLDYVVKILEPDFSAISGVETLLNTCLLSVSPNKTLIMHRLHQEMGKNVVFQESTKFPAKRSRIWLSSDSYNILSLGEGSKKVEGLAIDMKMLRNEGFEFTASELTTDALKNMDSLKLLQLNFVEPSGSYERFSKHLRWLCWHGFHLATIPSDLYMGNLVAIDMSYSNLEIFEPPMVLQSLRILNLKESHKLFEIRSIFKIPHLETLILWNCYSLVNVCKSIGDLTSLAILNMTGCKNLFRHTNMSTSRGVDTKQPTFSFPSSLHQLFLKDCHLISTDSFPLSFGGQPDLQYLNLGNSLFEFLSCYNSIERLRVLDLSFSSRLKCLLCLPSTLAELYICGCELLETITFESPQFNLQEFRYEGCIHLYEIEGFFKLVPVAKLDETDLGHLKWLKKYKKYEVCLVGDDELTVGRSRHIQMLYEFGIISTSLPDIMDPNMTPKYISKSSALSFDVPSIPRKRLEGTNVTFKYEISGEDWAWFCKISTTNGDVDLMYNPKVFGKLESGEMCIWLSYWPIGNKLSVGDTVNVSIVVMSGLVVHECGVSLVYSNQETVKTNMGWIEIVGGDLSRFQLSTGAYYLCGKDFFELVVVGRLTLDWFRLLVGDTIEYTEVRGWRNSGQPKLVNQSQSELKTIRHIIHDPELGDTCNMAEKSKSSFGDKTMALTSGTKSELVDKTMVEIHDKQYKSSDFISTFDETTMEESDPYSHKIVLAVNLSSKTKEREMLHALSMLQGIESVNYDNKEEKLTVIGDVDSETLISHARKIADINFSSARPASEMSADNTVAVTSGTRSELSNETMDEMHDNFISTFNEMALYESDLYSLTSRHSRLHERRVDSATDDGENSSLSTSTHLCRSFSLTEIISATKNFDDEMIIGKGGFGTVYKGQMAGHLVAIKRAGSTSSQGALAFRTEINILSTLRHRHLVPLIGYCHENKEMILVFKFMSKGTLYHHLHIDNTPLSWLTRLKIAIGAARGLDYLHTGVSNNYGVIHCDVKSTNILLDASCEAMITDFGISKICPTDQSIFYVETSVQGTYGTNQSISHVYTTVKGTFGYLDPEYFNTSKLSMKTDVYAFGVVLFELLSGRLAVDPHKEDDQSLLVTWAQKCVNDRKLNKLVDPNIKGTISTKCLRKFTQMAARCVHSVPKDRPTMNEVMASLQVLLELQEKSNRYAQSSCIMGFLRKI